MDIVNKCHSYFIRRKVHDVFAYAKFESAKCGILWKKALCSIAKECTNYCMCEKNNVVYDMIINQNCMFCLHSNSAWALIV